MRPESPRWRDSEQGGYPNGNATSPVGPPLVPSGSRVVVVVSAGPHPSPPTAFVVTPPVVGKDQGKALAELQEVGLQAQVFNDYSDSLKRGDVIGQLPAAGASTPAGSEAVLIVSSGKAPAPTAAAVLPEVVGKTEQEAVAAAAAGRVLAASGARAQPVRTRRQGHRPVAQRPLACRAPAKSNGWILWVAIAAAVVLLGLLAFFFLRGSGGKVVVPDVTGMTQEEAVKELEDAGLEVKVTEADEEQAGDADEGTVVEQNPPAGTEVNEGDEEEIVVVPPKKLVEVPDVRKQNQADATKALQDAGLVVSVTREFSNTVEKGLVISQSPTAGQKVPPGTTVGIAISEGPQVKNVDVPDVVGMKKADAENALKDAGLKVVVAESPSDEVAKGARERAAARSGRVGGSRYEHRHRRVDRPRGLARRGQRSRRRWRDARRGTADRHLTRGSTRFRCQRPEPASRRTRSSRSRPKAVPRCRRAATSCCTTRPVRRQRRRGSGAIDRAQTSRYHT